MNIFEADISDSRYLVENLWRPMVEEMEEVSELNKLADDSLEEDAFEYFDDRLNDSEHRVFIAETNESPQVLSRLKLVQEPHSLREGSTSTYTNFL